MIVSTPGSLLRILVWQWVHIALFVLAGTAIAVVHLFVWPAARVPALPLAVVGGALGIFVSFRTNSAYGRWWEARQLWGRLINLSRTFASQVLSYYPSDGDGRALAESMVRRHIAYVHVLRVLLRDQSVAKDADVQALVPAADRDALEGQSNVTYTLAHRNVIALGRAAREHFITDHQLLAIDETLRGIVDVQGGCERIKRTPFPRGYTFIASRLLVAFSFIFPLAVVAELGWWVVPVNVLVCLAFALISEVGRVLEDPFTMFVNGLPLSAMSKTIEINLRQQLGDTDLPAMPVPDQRGVLM